jgi:eukaryotic-like serine/threonine-protein kinase
MMADLKFLAGEWPIISRRLDEALSLTVAERDTWLDSLQEKESIKLKLRSLLADAGSIETRDFLEAPPPLTLGLFEDSDAEADSDIAKASMLIGPYRLIAELGVGGMGSVWLAERADGGLKREVALKLPRVNWSRGLAERMRRERDILASLDHPNIARIYEAGLDIKGRPYLALEYVEGEPIDVYCKQRALGINERLQLLLQVARAVAHAHARLVVHRDLKPANILVTADGQVRLLDFGIAKLLEGELTQETQLTQIAGRALTLDYASPEQIRGDPIGTASDVYSLGVVAYELLAQAKPYQLKRQSAAALEDAIANVDVRLASAACTTDSAHRALLGDLDAILNKALKKDVSQRYATVDAFAQDIERYLAFLPVLAQPDTAGYRLRKFIVRNKLFMATTTISVIAIVAGASVALWQSGHARSQAARAVQVKDFVLSIFNDADSESEVGVSRSAADLLRLARVRIASDTMVESDLAVELMTAIGKSMVGQGLTADAASLLKEAEALALTSLGDSHLLTRAVRVAHAEALFGLGRSVDAIAVIQPAITSARSAGDQNALCAGLRLLSRAQLNEGQLDPAIDSAREAMLSAFARRPVAEKRQLHDIMEAQRVYANALAYAHKPDTAQAARAALASAQTLYGDKVTSAVLNIRTLLAIALVREGKREEGLRELKTLVPATVELLGPQHPQVANTANIVGNARLALGDVRGAMNDLKLAVSVTDQVAGDVGDFNRGIAQLTLAGAYMRAYEPLQSLPLLDIAVELLQSREGSNKELTWIAMSLRAGQLGEAGRIAEAATAFDAMDATPWINPLPRSSHYSRLAIFRALLGRHREAVDLAQQAIELASGAGKDSMARLFATQGQVLLANGNLDAARASLLKSQVLFTESEIGVSPQHAEALVALGRARMQLGEIDASATILATAASAWHAFDPKNRHAGLAKLYLADALWAQGDKGAAKDAWKEADAVLIHSAFAADRVLLESMRQKLGA